MYLLVLGLLVIYASVDTFTYFEVQSPKGLSPDLTIGTVEGIEPGAYRRVDPTFLGFIAGRIAAGLENPKINREQLTRAIMFFHELIDLTGLTPAKTIPPGYTKPEACNPLLLPNGKKELWR